MKTFILFLLLYSTINAAKIDDIANVVGVRDNQVIGYSLVVGLNKTGDGTTSKFTLDILNSLLQS